MNRKTDWKPSAKTIGDRLSIEHVVTGEIALVGRRGEIWIYSDKIYCAVITNHLLANRLCLKLGRKALYRAGDEALFKFDADLLPTMIESIKPFKYQEWQIQKASEFGMPISSNISGPQAKSTPFFDSKRGQTESVGVKVLGLELDRPKGQISKAFPPKKAS